MKTLKWNVDNNVDNLESNPQVVEAANYTNS